MRSHIKSFLTCQNFRRTACLALALTLAGTALGKPLIQTIQVSPNPLIAGEAFTITVTGSADVSVAAATVDGAVRIEEIPEPGGTALPTCPR